MTPRRRPRRSGRRGSAAGRLIVLALAVLAAVGRPVSAQVPADSVPVPPDADGTLALPDSVAADSLSAAQDTASADTIFYNLPGPRGGVPSGFESGSWTFDRQAIMTSAANTVAELVATVPGLVALFGGDYGTPTAVSAFGLGGGGVRMVRDGIELFPLEGGVADLARVGLGGLDEVRIRRGGGEIVIELTSHRFHDGRVFSLVEAGTGQLDTNLFRGLYADPTALGGSIALALDRVDTRGFGTDEGGNRTGAWFRYQWHLRDRAGLAFDYRRMGSETQVADYQSSGHRNDVSVRGSAELFSGVTLEAYAARSTHEVNDSRDEYADEGGRRSQYGGRLSVEGAGLWARGSTQLLSGDDLPSRRLGVEGGYQSAVVSASGHWSTAAWDGTDLSAYGASGWLGPFAGISLFGSYDTGTFGARSGPITTEPEPTLPPFPPTPPPPPLTYEAAERSLLRGGVSLSLFDSYLAVAGLRAHADLHVPLNLELDRGAPSVSGIERRGVEGTASVPVSLMEGLRLEGSYQHWDREGPYLPQRNYKVGFTFHRLYLESGNFEMWWSLGVDGHDPMIVFVSDDGSGSGGVRRVPFYQNWYGRIQVRIVTVRLFFTWENIAVRRNLQTYPGRLLPPLRSFFGLRWDLWN